MAGMDDATFFGSLRSQRLCLKAELLNRFEVSWQNCVIYETGSFFCKLGFLKYIYSMCRRRGVKLIGDELHHRPPRWASLLFNATFFLLWTQPLSNRFGSWSNTRSSCPNRISRYRCLSPGGQATRRCRPLTNYGCSSKDLTSLINHEAFEAIQFRAEVVAQR